MTFSLIVTVHNNLEGIDVFKKDLSIYKKYFNEVIIIDDSSDDGSWEALQRLKSKKNLIIRQTPFNSGRPSIPRNMGLKIASKKFVTFLDIGDRITEKYLRHTQKQIAINDLNFYSGIKTTYRNLDKAKLIHGDDAFQIKISKFILSYKNFKSLIAICF
jgi:glycosyltransferase involved in cell wall biosynthesis